jgi:hypothetical protein
VKLDAIRAEAQSLSAAYPLKPRDITSIFRKTDCRPRSPACARSS